MTRSARGQAAVTRGHGGEREAVVVGGRVQRRRDVAAMRGTGTAARRLGDDDRARDRVPGLGIEHSRSRRQSRLDVADLDLGPGR